MKEYPPPFTTYLGLLRVHNLRHTPEYTLSKSFEGDASKAAFSGVTMADDSIRSLAAHPHPPPAPLHPSHLSLFCTTCFT